MNESLKKAQKKYESMRVQKKISLHKERDKLIIDYLNGIDDTSKYIKNLILEEMTTKKKDY